MASHTASDSGQLAMMFEVVQTANVDGSFTIKPKRVTITEEFAVRRAAQILKTGADTIRRLCGLGEKHGGLKAYKDPSERNAKSGDGFDAPLRVRRFLRRGETSRLARWIGSCLLRVAGAALRASDSPTFDPILSL